MTKVNLETNVEKLMEYGETGDLQAKILSELRKLGNVAGIEVYEHQAYPFHYCFCLPGRKEFFEKYLTDEEAKEYLENELSNLAVDAQYEISHGSAICPWNAEGTKISDFI